MYQNEPVLIPDLPGKISFKKKNGSEYVQYLTERKYDPVRRYMLPDRKIIGIRIPSLPEMMLPNENYQLYIEGGRDMNEEQKKTATMYEINKKRFIMLRELFDQMYYEFQIQSRKKPDDPVNSYKAQRINSILEPLKEMMAGEEYADYLDLIDVSEGQDQDNSDCTGGKTYSDVALLLSQYRGSMKRYFSEKM